MKPRWKLLLDARMRVAYAVLLVVLAVSVFEFFHIRRNLQDEARQRFKAELQAVNLAVQRGLLKYLDTVRSARPFVRNSSPGTPVEVTPTIDVEWKHRAPGLIDVGYAEFVEDTPGHRTLLVKTVTARQNNLHPVGSTLPVDDEIKNAQKMAAETGYGSATPDRTIANDNVQSVRGGLLFIPVFANPQPKIGETKAAVVRGYAFGTFITDELWRDVLSATTNNAVAMAKVGTAEADALSQTPDPLGRTLTVTTWGRPWLLVCGARRPFISASAQHLPTVILCLGTAIALLAFVVVATQVQQRIGVDAAMAESDRLNAELENRVIQRTAELRAANSQLLESLEKEKELNQLKSSFVSTVSHEFRTPLGVIVSSAGILDRYLDRLTPEQRNENLRNIQHSAAVMTDLIDGALVLSKAEAGCAEFFARSTSLLTLCLRICDEVKSATNSRCPIEFSSLGEVDHACADEKLLRTILTNLLTNAVKYSVPGTPVRFTLDRQKRDAVFRIEDRGIGIPEKDLPNLFNPFFRAENARTHAGTGLGLALVKTCVNIHGGKIAVDSTEGQGTTVTVCLPLFADKKANA